MARRKKRRSFGSAGTDHVRRAKNAAQDVRAMVSRGRQHLAAGRCDRAYSMLVGALDAMGAYTSDRRGAGKTRIRNMYTGKLVAAFKKQCVTPR